MHLPRTCVCLFSYGGVHKNAVGCLVRDIGKAAADFGRASVRSEFRHIVGLDGIPAWDVQFMLPPQDALIDRSRATAAKAFLMGNAEVFLMIDHDISWQPPSQGYEGDLCFLARKAAETQGIVGAMVSKKTRGEGIASMFKTQGEVPVGPPAGERLEPAWYVGGAFTAVHRSVIEDVGARMEEIPPGFKPIFLPIEVDHPLAPGQKLHISEDWALCHRAREVGHESWLALRPIIKHIGEQEFDVFTAQPNAPPPDAAPVQPPAPMAQTAPTITCIHATRRRPEQAAATAKIWSDRAAHPQLVEYIISCDDDDSVLPDVQGQIVKGKSRGCVDAYNRGAYLAQGQVLVQVHDDLEPPQGWDDAIMQAIGDPSQPRLLWVNDGNEANRHKPWLIPLAIETKAFARELGGMFFPDYISVYCDDDMTLFALKHCYVTDARHLTFKHNWGGPDRDETQRRSYSGANHRDGEITLAARKVAGFPKRLDMWRGK